MHWCAFGRNDRRSPAAALGGGNGRRRIEMRTRDKERDENPRQKAREQEAQRDRDARGCDLVEAEVEQGSPSCPRVEICRVKILERPPNRGVA